MARHTASTPGSSPDAPAGSDASVAPLTPGSWGALLTYVARRTIANGLAAVLLFMLARVARGLIDVPAGRFPGGEAAFGSGLGTSWASRSSVADLFAERLGSSTALLIGGTLLAWAGGALLGTIGWLAGRQFSSSGRLHAFTTAAGRIYLLGLLGTPAIVIVTVAIVINLDLGAPLPFIATEESVTLVLPTLIFAAALSPLLALVALREVVWVQGLSNVDGVTRFVHFLRRWMAGAFDLTAYALLVMTIVEFVFRHRGIGALTVTAVQAGDGPVVWASVLLAGLLVLVTRQYADLLRAGDALVSRGPLPPPPAPVAVWPLGRLWVRLALAAVAVGLLLTVLSAPGAPYDPVSSNLQARSQPPSRQHLFGTDALGRDQFSRAIGGLRTTALIGAGGGAIGWLAGVLWGSVAGLLARRTSGIAGPALADLLFLPVDAIRAVPWLGLGLFLALIGNPGTGLLIALLAIALGPRVAAATRDLWTRAPAERSSPTLFSSVGAATLPLTIAAGIAITSTMGYLGLGVQPPSPELGLLISDWELAETGSILFLAPALALAFLSWSWLLLADALTERARLYGRLAWNELMS